MRSFRFVKPTPTAAAQAPRVFDNWPMRFRCKKLYSVKKTFRVGNRARKLRRRLSSVQKIIAAIVNTTIKSAIASSKRARARLTQTAVADVSPATRQRAAGASSGSSSGKTLSSALRSLSMRASASRLARLAPDGSSLSSTVAFASRVSLTSAISSRRSRLQTAPFVDCRALLAYSKSAPS